MEVPSTLHRITDTLRTPEAACSLLFCFAFVVVVCSVFY